MSIVNTAVSIYSLDFFSKTVERMQTTVQSLEELARQSKINYTVVANSPYMEYFQNMAGAEDELYKKWKEITLNSTSDQTRYRVWDYPVREQYTHILKVIEQNKPVATPEEGFAKVNEATQGDFAFIHDASEVRYQYYEICNFTEIGEPFAEQPLAVAVQQGSHLQKDISRTILELQKERYFETLSGKYPFELYLHFISTSSLYQEPTGRAATGLTVPFWTTPRASPSGHLAESSWQPCAACSCP